MASSYDPLTQVELQGTGENPGTWGGILNANVIQLLSEAMHKVVTVPVPNDISLTAVNAGTDQARCAGLRFTGVGGAVTAPSRSHIYLVFNECSNAVQLKGAATTGVSIPAGSKCIVAWTGADFSLLDPASEARAWATLTSASVDGTSFSSKEYAQGTQAATGGSAKNWSQQTGADVTGAAANSRSAKGWAQDVLTGATLGGSSKDWAKTTGGTVDGAEYSAKEWAAGTTATSAKQWAQKTGATVDGSEYSAKEYAGGTTVESARTWATSTTALTGGFLGARGYALAGLASANNAATSETNSANSATASGNTATASANSATASANSATASAASAVTAANAAAAIIGTSTTSLAIGAGSKSPTTQPGKQFFVGQRIRSASAAAPTTKYMDGVVTAYNSGTGALAFTADVAVGSGSAADWNIGPAGEQGTQGNPGPTGPAGGGALYAAKSANYTVLATDNNYLLECTNSITLALTAAATLTNTFSFWVSNVGTGVITIDPNGSELIDGAATQTVQPGQVRLVQCTGTAFETTPFISSPQWAQIGSTVTVGSPVASISFTSIPTTYSDLLLSFDGVSHNGSAGQAFLEYSIDNGSSWASTRIATGPAITSSDNLTGAALLFNYRRNAAQFICYGSIAAAPSHTTGTTNAAGVLFVTGGINALRLVPTAGSWDAGTVKLEAR